MRCGDEICVDAILRDQQPSREPLTHSMEPIACSVLCHQHRTNGHSLEQRIAKVRNRGKQLVYVAGICLETMSGNLDDHAMKSRHPFRQDPSHHVLWTGYSYLYTFAVAGLYHQGGEPVIQKEQ